mgnify:CR=1 FL=1
METIETEFNEEKASDRVNEDAKRIAIISYITVIGLMIAFVMNNEKKHSYTQDLSSLYANYTISDNWDIFFR